MPIVALFWVADRWLTDDGYVGWERNTVRNSVHRWDKSRRWENERRPKVAVFGSSTSVDWLDLRKPYLANLLGVRRGDILDAHMNGCHQGCTWAEVRRMQQRQNLKRCYLRGKNQCDPPKEKRFETVFFGTNLFQLCENTHSKRSLQHSMLTPTVDIPALMNIYLEAEEPLLYIGRFWGTKISGGYADTIALRDYWGRKTIGKGRRGQSHRWYRAQRPKAEKDVLSCVYTPEAVAFKRRLTEGLLDDLHTLTDQVYLMLLPERSLGLDDPEHKRRWAAHLDLHASLADARPWVTLVDLVTDGVSRHDHFRDDIHLNGKGMKVQRALFEKRLEALGVGATTGRSKK